MHKVGNESIDKIGESFSEYRARTHLIDNSFYFFPITNINEICSGPNYAGMPLFLYWRGFRNDFLVLTRLLLVVYIDW